jgi:hypothetical protein
MTTYRGFTLTRTEARRMIERAIDDLLTALARHGIVLPLDDRPSPRRRRRRRPMSPARRAVLSRHMRARWAARRAAGKSGRLDT